MPETAHRNDAEGLRAGALGLQELVFQAISHLGPAVGIIVVAPVLVGFVGGSAPLMLLVALAAVLLTGLCVASLARRLPSAGGYYTYVSHGLGERAGFVTAWAYFLYDPLLPTLVLLVSSGILAPVLTEHLGVPVPWWAIVVVLLGVVYVATYLGVRLSARLTLVLGLAETLILVAFGVAVLGHSGADALSAEPFTLPPLGDSVQPLFLAFAFGVLLFTGFESAAPLAEEASDPRRAIPRTVVWSIVVVGLVWTFVGYALVVGWGVDRAGELVADANPFFTLADQVASWIWVLLVLALLNSALAAALAGQNAGARVIYALARAELLPRPLARVHARHRTPVVALGVVTVVNLVASLALGAWLGPIGAFGFIGLFVTLGVIVVYVMGNLSVLRLYRTRFRADWHPVRHGVVPIAATAILLLGLYLSVWPLPAWPLNLAAAVVACWLALGVAVSLLLWRTRRSQLTAAATLVFEEGA